MAAGGLPFLPRDYKYNVIPSVSRQYDVVHKMLHREDIDTGLLGRRCQEKKDRRSRKISGKFGGSCSEGMKELRVWIDSQTEEEILRGIREAKDMSEYDKPRKVGRDADDRGLCEWEPIFPEPCR